MNNLQFGNKAIFKPTERERHSEFWDNDLTRHINKECLVLRSNFNNTRFYVSFENDSQIFQLSSESLEKVEIPVPVQKTFEQLSIERLDIKVGDRVTVLYSPSGRTKHLIGDSSYRVTGMNYDAGTVDIVAAGTNYRVNAVNIKKVTEVTIQLTDSYKAVISAESVKVGCQTIPISKVKEVVKELNKLGVNFVD